MQICVCATIILSLFASSQAASLPTSLVSSRIVNGYEIDISEIPYQAALRRKVFAGWTHSCGAVIIHKRAVLTAAHCVNLYENQPSDLRIVVGTSNRLNGGTSYDVTQIFIHHLYSSITLANDIAMVVTNSIHFDRTVKAVPFASSSFIIPDGMEAIVSGYGTTSHEGKVSQVLRAAKVQVVPQATCLRAYLRIGTVTSEMICAGASNPSRDACQGDSGGPLVADGTLIGLVSWGEGCGDKKYPGVYTRISVYNNWIQSQFSRISGEFLG